MDNKPEFLAGKKEDQSLCGWMLVQMGLITPIDPTPENWEEAERRQRPEEPIFP